MNIPKLGPITVSAVDGGTAESVPPANQLEIQILDSPLKCMERVGYPKYEYIIIGSIPSKRCSWRADGICIPMKRLGIQILDNPLYSIITLFINLYLIGIKIY
jgi:hypothetical protein